jgi:hypothetical protein
VRCVGIIRHISQPTTLHEISTAIGIDALGNHLALHDNVNTIVKTKLYMTTPIALNMLAAQKRGIFKLIIENGICVNSEQFEVHSLPETFLRLALVGLKEELGHATSDNKQKDKKQ